MYCVSFYSFIRLSIHLFVFLFLISFFFGTSAPAGACRALFCDSHFLKDRSKSRFDSGFVIYAKFRAVHNRDLVGRCFLRRVMAWDWNSKVSLFLHYGNVFVFKINIFLPCRHAATCRLRIRCQNVIWSDLKKRDVRKKRKRRDPAGADVPKKNKIVT